MTSEELKRAAIRVSDSLLDIAKEEGLGFNETLKVAVVVTVKLALVLGASRPRTEAFISQVWDILEREDQANAN